MSQRSRIESSLENVLSNLGGIHFANCYSPAPDTPRTLATVFTGLPPSENGCDRRDKWPGHNLVRNVDSVFKLAIEHGFRVSALLSEKETSTDRFLPEDCRKQVRTFSCVDDLLQSIRLDSSSHELIFVQDNDCHYSVSDHFAFTAGHSLGMTRVAKNLQYVLDGLGKDCLDSIVIFSDHGFAPFRLFDRRDTLRFSSLHRSKVLFHFWSREFNQNQISCRLTSTVEIGVAIRTMVQTLSASNAARELMESPDNSAIVIEDYSTHATNLGGAPDLWCAITPRNIYIESASGESLALALSVRKRCDPRFDRYTPGTEELHDFQGILRANSESFRGWERMRRSLGADLPESAAYMDSTLRTRGVQALMRIFCVWLKRFYSRLS